MLYHQTGLGFGMKESSLYSNFRELEIFCHLENIYSGSSLAHESVVGEISWDKKILSLMVFLSLLTSHWTRENSYTDCFIKRYTFIGTSQSYLGTHFRCHIHIVVDILVGLSSWIEKGFASSDFSLSIQSSSKTHLLLKLMTLVSSYWS